MIPRCRSAGFTSWALRGHGAARSLRHGQGLASTTSRVETNDALPAAGGAARLQGTYRNGRPISKEYRLLKAAGAPVLCGKVSMTMVRRTALCFLAAIVFQSLDSAAQLTAPPVRQIDHIMIRATDPGRLYAFFTELLQLPVAWPMMTPRPGVTTGGVGFGNVNVEAIQFPEQKPRPSPAQLLGFAFEPAPLRECLAELDRRGLTYGELRPIAATGQDGSRSTRWTNVTLRQFSDSDGPADATIHVFLTEYSPTYVNVEERRERLRQQLTERGGGPLGIEAVKEIVIGVIDLEAARGLWQKLLDPARSSETNAWQVGSGPAVRLVKANSNEIQELVVLVNSLPRAKAFLQERALLGRYAEEEATIESSKIDGLNIRLVGRR